MAANNAISSATDESPARIQLGKLVRLRGDDPRHLTARENAAVKSKLANNQILRDGDSTAPEKRFEINGLVKFRNQSGENMIGKVIEVRASGYTAKIKAENSKGKIFVLHINEVEKLPGNFPFPQKR